MIVYVIIAIYLVYEIMRTLEERVRTLSLQCRYELFAVRDSLRDLAIEDKVDANSTLFKYLDSSIGRFIEYLPQLTIYKVLFIYFVVRRNSEAKKRMAAFEKELAKPGHESLKEINDRYTDHLSWFLIKRHIVVFCLYFSLYLIFGPTFKKAARRKVEDISARVVESPQTPLIFEPAYTA